MSGWLPTPLGCPQTSHGFIIDPPQCAVQPVKSSSQPSESGGGEPARSVLKTVRSPRTRFVDEAWRVRRPSIRYLNLFRPSFLLHSLPSSDILILDVD